VAADSRHKPALVAELVRAMEWLCREKALAFMMFKDFPASALVLLAPLVRQGFLRGDSFPNVVLPLPYAAMEEYLASLSYGTRKGLRRKVRQALSDGLLKVRVVDRVDDMIDSVYKLYINTYDAGTVHFEKLTPEYFIKAGSEQRSQAKFFLYYIDGRLVCFNLCFRHADRLIDKFIGMDYSVTRLYNLYFYSWYHNVQWCIQNGIRYYQVGQTDHDAKVHLGGTLVPLYFYAKHRNRILNSVLRMAARFLMPRP
jgi:predicted N-acyltransferase